METINVQISEEEKSLLKSFLNKKLLKYRADDNDDPRFKYYIYLKVFIFIDDKILQIRNEVEPIKYFGELEDVAKLHFELVKENEISSGLLNRKQKDTFINEIINKIFIINEKQIEYYNDNKNYEMNYTKGIIFETNLNQYAFIKDSWDLDEDIEIEIGSNVINKVLNEYDKEEKDSDEWVVKIERTIEELL